METIGSIENKCECWLVTIMSKIVIITPKITLINNIRTPSNYPSKHILKITASGTNIHLEKNPHRQ